MANPVVHYGQLLFIFALFATAVLLIARISLRKASPATRRGTVRWVFLGFLYLLTASVVLDAFMARWGFRGDNSRYGFEAMVQLQAEKPYAYRVLFPLLVRAGTAAIPPTFIRRNEDFFLRTSELSVYREPREEWTLEKSVHWHVAYALQFLSLIGGMLLARLFLRQLLPETPPAFADFAPPIGALFLMMTFIHGGYIYDLPELVLLFAGALLVARKKLLAYYIVFLLAALNKETGVFLVVYFVALLWDELPRRKLLMHATAQVMIGAVVIVGLRYLFRGSPGQPIDWRVGQHFDTWINPMSYFKFYDFSAPLIWIPQATNIITLALTGALALIAWPRMSATLKRFFVVVLVVSTGLVLLGGYPGEVRNFSLFFPPLFVVVVAAMAGLYAAPVRSA